MVIRDKRLLGFSVTNYRELTMNFTTNYSFTTNFTNHTNVACVINSCNSCDLWSVFHHEFH